MLVAVARRALLEDKLAALDEVQGIDLVELLEIEKSSKAIKRLEEMIRRLHALAGGAISVMRECRELDDRLGLTPKGMQFLRWSIDKKSEDSEQPAPVANVRRLRAVDPGAVAGA